MHKSTQEIKAQFELEFYIVTKDYQDQYRGKEPTLTWVNEDKKPIISLKFLLFVDRYTRVQIAMLLDKYSLMVKEYRANLDGQK